MLLTIKLTKGRNRVGINLKALVRANVFYNSINILKSTNL